VSALKDVRAFALLLTRFVAVDSARVREGHRRAKAVRKRSKWHTNNVTREVSYTTSEDNERETARTEITVSFQSAWRCEKTKMLGHKTHEMLVKGVLVC